MRVTEIYRLAEGNMAVRREISIYMDEEQAQLLRRAAALQGLSISSWSRSILLDRARDILSLQVDARVMRAGEKFEDADASLTVATGKIQQRHVDRKK